MRKCLPNERCNWYVCVYGGYTEPIIDYFEFKPEDVLPKYDIYDNGRMVLYIKRKKFFGLREVVELVSESNIYYEELPERRICE
jgi:hypothetical protein